MIIFHIVLPTATTFTALTGVQYVGLLTAVGAILFSAVVLPSAQANGPVRTTLSMKPAWLMQVSDYVHLVAGAFWLGGVLCLSLFVRRAEHVPARSLHVPARSLAQVVSRFSTLAVVSVLLLTASGVVMTVIIADSWLSLTATDFGTTLGAKLLLVLAVLGLAAWNRFRVVPTLNAAASHAPVPNPDVLDLPTPEFPALDSAHSPEATATTESTPASSATAKLFKRTITGEAALLVAISLVTGILTHTNPHSATAPTAPPTASVGTTEAPATSPTKAAQEPAESSQSAPQAPVEMMVEEGVFHVHGYLDTGVTGVNSYKYEIFTSGGFSVYDGVAFEVFAPGTDPESTENPEARAVPRVNPETEYSFVEFDFTQPGDWRVDVLIPVTPEQITRLSMWAQIPTQ